MSNMPFKEWVKMQQEQPDDWGEQVTLPMHAVMFIYEENEKLWAEKIARNPPFDHGNGD